MKYMTAMALGLFAMGPLGCSTNKSVDLGGNAGAALSDYSGNWDGYAEAYSFDSTGSDRVRLTVDAEGRGTIRFGDASLLIPPTDPTSPFPPDQGGSQIVWVGFEYPLYDGKVEGGRIQLGVSPNDLYLSWCELQTTAANSLSPTGYGCVVQTVPFDPSLGGCFSAGDSTPDGGGPDSGLSVGVNCAQAFLCGMSSTCTCTATGCGVAALAPGTSPVKVDATLENAGASLVGTLLLSENTRLTIRLQKQ